VIAAYAIATLAIGYLAKRGHESASDLLVGGRSLPTWAVLASMVATELSAATFLGVPDAAYNGSWTYLELAFGALLGKLAVSIRVIPLYHRLGVLSIYQLLAQRFGRSAQRAASLCFIAGRLLASGVRLFIAALAFSVVTGAGVEIAIVGCGVIAGLYTRAGGIRSVIWTDALQAGVFLAGALALLGAAVAAADGGLAAILAWAAPHGRTEIFSGPPWLSLSSARPFGTAVIGGFFLTLATHGTDHDMVQRLLAARGGRAGGLALFGSALLNFPLTLLFLLVGTGIAYTHAMAPSMVDLPDAGRVVPTFALSVLPAGLRGLVFAGLFAAAMSSLDSAICAIATTWTVDLSRDGATGSSERLAARTRRASVLASVLLIAAALAMAAYHAALAASTQAGGPPSLVEFALSAMTILYGGLLGVFAVAVLGRGGSAAGAVAGLIAGSGVGLALFLHPLLLGTTLLAWTWWIPLAAGVSAAVTLAVPRLFRPRSAAVEPSEPSAGAGPDAPGAVDEQRMG
jgi:SSS family transporter